MNNVDLLRNELEATGSVSIPMPDGKKLILVASSQLSFVSTNTRALLIAYEGAGAFLWDISTKMDVFVLIQAGFSLRLAPSLVEVLNTLVGSKRMANVPRLNRPEAAAEE